LKSLSAGSNWPVFAYADARLSFAEWSASYWDGDPLERADRHLVVVLGEGLLGLVPQRAGVAEGFHRDDDLAVLLAPLGVLADLRVVQEVAAPLARLLGGEALLSESLELVFRDRDLRRQPLPLGQPGRRS
jgi:hypothetical protein